MSVAKLHSDADTAWMLTSTALVIFMTLPGLILYYAGQAKVHHVLDIATHVLATFCVITLAWFSFGYSLALAPITPHRASSTPIYGDASRLWLRGMKYDSYHVNAMTIPEPIYCAFQLAFACITAALVGGSFAERVQLLPFLLFIVLWHFVVYCPIAHAVWHPDGFLYQAGVLDFAGGNVVHITAGFSGLVGTWIIGNRRGFSRSRHTPHNLLLTFMGVSMLFFGWMGFNGGSANQANGIAAMAVLNTIIAVVTAALSWTLAAALFQSDEAPFLSLNNGLIAGLVAVTPACGYIDANGAFWCGVFSGFLCNIGAKLKHWAGFDDALDAFGLHAIGGTIGCIITGFFALSTGDAAGPVTSGVYYASMKNGGHQLGIQLYSVAVCAGWSLFATFCILKPLDMAIGFRRDDDLESEPSDNLNASSHGDVVVARVPTFVNPAPDQEAVKATWRSTRGFLSIDSQQQQHQHEHEHDADEVDGIELVDSGDEPSREC